MAEIDWDEYINEYHEGHPGITEQALAHACHPVHGTAHQWLAAVVPEEAGDVVDLACGSCPMQPLINYRTYLGIDRNAAELAAARSAGRGPVRIGDVTALDLPDASVDTVVMAMALMLVPTQDTLDQVSRVLRPGGVFAAMVPAYWPFAARDFPASVLLSLALRGPGSMPRTLSSRSLAAHFHRSGLLPESACRQRFPFPLATTDDARLAVSSLYTPGRSPSQLQRAETWLAALAALPGRPELPVPLLRVTARRR